MVMPRWNGFRGTANAMATSIATGALRPKVAVLIAGALTLVGAFLPVEVAKAISNGLVDETRIAPVAIFAGWPPRTVWGGRRSALRPGRASPPSACSRRSRSWGTGCT